MHQQPRNHALDFMQCPGAHIRVSELSEYAAFCKLSPDDKRALHGALLEHLNATVEERWFWAATGPFKEKCYRGIYWNLDRGFPDFETFWLQSQQTKLYTPPIGEPT
jgi:hypothetical protein